MSTTGPLDVEYTVPIAGDLFVSTARSAAILFINIAVERLYKE